MVDPFAELPTVETEEEIPKEKSKKPKGRSFFDCLRVIYQTKDATQMENDIGMDNFDSFYSKYMVNRYLSMVPEYLDIIRNCQLSMESMTNEMHYRFLFKVIPQRRNLWIKYISKKGKGK